MNEERAKDLIRQAQAHMNGEATSQAIAALTTVDEEHKMFLGNLYVASWQSSPANIGAPWQATLTIHSTQVQANFDTEEEAIVWLANRVGALMWAYQYATRNHAEVVRSIPLTQPTQ